MCLYTNREKPLVASRDIKVYKHVSVISTVKKMARTPCQDVYFDLNKDFIAKPDYVQIKQVNKDTWEINGGAIHACLWPDFSRDKCLEAIIPQGTEYWFGVDKSTICAKKLFVTDKEVIPEDNAGLDPVLSYDVYLQAPKNSKGVKIGDFLIYGEFASPSVAKGVSKNEVQGIVVGFNGDEPEVADIQHIFREISIDNEYDSRPNKYISSTDEAKKDMNGRENTQAWKQICEGDANRYEAYNAVTKLSENHYIPALGEMELIWSNLIYIAAGCSLANITCPFTMEGYYWTSTEFSQRNCWYSCLFYGGAFRFWDRKDYHGSMVPFVASAKKIN